MRKINSAVSLLCIFVFGMIFGLRLYPVPLVMDEYGGFISGEDPSLMLSGHVYRSMAANPAFYADDYAYSARPTGYAMGGMMPTPRTEYGEAPSFYDPQAARMGREHSMRYAEELMSGDHEIPYAPPRQRAMLIDSSEALRLHAQAQFEEDEVDFRSYGQRQRPRFSPEEADEYDREDMSRAEVRRFYRKSYQEREQERLMRRSQDAEYDELTDRTDELQARNAELMEEIRKMQGIINQQASARGKDLAAQREMAAQKEMAQRKAKQLSAQLKQAQEELEEKRHKLVDEDLAAAKIQRAVRQKELKFTTENRKAIAEVKQQLGVQNFVEKIDSMIAKPGTKQEDFEALVIRKELSDGSLANHPFSPAMLHTYARSAVQTIAQLEEMKTAAGDDTDQVNEYDATIAKIKLLQGALEARRKQEKADAKRRLDIARAKLAELEQSGQADEEIEHTPTGNRLYAVNDSEKKESGSKKFKSRDKVFWSRGIARKASISAVEKEIERLKALKKLTKPSEDEAPDPGKLFDTRTPEHRIKMKNTASDKAIMQRVEAKREKRPVFVRPLKPK